MKERPIIFNEAMVRAILDGRKTQTRRIVKHQPLEGVAPDSSWIRPCDVGDRLWVREKWAQSSFGQTSLTFYGADREHDPPHIAKCARWQPSIHMPRAASRITLEVTGVRVERLQDISEGDAIAEGCSIDGESPSGLYVANNARSAFCRLWQSIYGPDSWNQNPWVWVIDFRVIENG